MFSGARSHSDPTAEEESKDRPPYVEAPDAKEPFKRKYKGACYCGEVEIAANSDPVVSISAATFPCLPAFSFSICCSNQRCTIKAAYRGMPTMRLWKAA